MKRRAKSGAICVQHFSPHRKRSHTSAAGTQAERITLQQRERALSPLSRRKLVIFLRQHQLLLKPHLLSSDNMNTKQIYYNNKLPKWTLVKLRALEIAEKHTKELLLDEAEQKTTKSLKTVEKLELIEDIIEKLPPYNWQQANLWTKKLLKLWREYGRSSLKAKEKAKPKPEEGRSAVQKLRALHFLEDSIRKILSQKGNRSASLLWNLEGYLSRMEKLISELPSCYLPQEWTEKVEKLRCGMFGAD